jgi:hypothetical protein
MPHASRWIRVAPAILLVGIGLAACHHKAPAADRIGIVSYGKEFPVCEESNEGCWQKNRRGHPVIVAKRP